MMRSGLCLVIGLMVVTPAVAVPPQTPEARALVQQGIEELMLARTAEQHREYAHRVAHLAQAINNFQWALRIMPDDYYAYHELGVAEFMSGRLASAVQYYTKAIALYPEAARSHMDRGNALYQLGQFEMASDDWKEAVRIDPSMAANLDANRAEQQRIYREVQALQKGRSI